MIFLKSYKNITHNLPEYCEDMYQSTYQEAFLYSKNSQKGG